ncbi:MAG: M48 family metalloprotease [Actinobacteria bacterium]|nr:M48 family metalloprotease [Actinomycetota bacterium]
MSDPGMFSSEEVERARDYHRPLYRYVVVRSATGLAYLAVLAFSPAGERLAGALDGLPRWAFVLALTAAVLLLGAAIRLPLGIWRHRYERRWGFSTQSLAGWLADVAKGTGVSLVLAGLSFLALVELASALPEAWPLVAVPAAALLAVLLSFVGPVVLEPLFNRFGPLDDPDLAEDLRRLSERAGVPVREVLVADASRRTTKHNAYVSGLGRTRRVVVFDNLLRGSGGRDVRLVVAHELGHRRERHVAVGTALSAGGAVVGVVVLWALLRWDALLEAAGAAGAGDPRVVPFVMLLSAVGGLLALPAGNAISRRLERTADRSALELTGDPEGFAEMMRRLALANLSDLAPPRPAYLMLFSHPTPAERIAAARASVRGFSQAPPLRTDPTTG